MRTNLHLWVVVWMAVGGATLASCAADPPPDPNAPAGAASSGSPDPDPTHERVLPGGRRTG